MLFPLELFLSRWRTFFAGKWAGVNSLPAFVRSGSEKLGRGDPSPAGCTGERVTAVKLECVFYPELFGQEQPQIFLNLGYTRAAGNLDVSSIPAMSVELILPFRRPD
jgi:hypothetical protein